MDDSPPSKRKARQPQPPRKRAKSVGAAALLPAEAMADAEAAPALALLPVALESGPVLAAALAALRDALPGCDVMSQLSTIDGDALLAVEALRDAGERALSTQRTVPACAPVRECPNRRNSAHRCTAYCFWRWKAACLAVADFHAARVPHPSVYRNSDSDDEELFEDVALRRDCNLSLPSGSTPVVAPAVGLTVQAEAYAIAAAAATLATVSARPGQAQRKFGERNRLFHNERERQRRTNIRALFQALRYAVPVIEHAVSTSDRQILLAAAAHATELARECAELEKSVLALRVSNLRLRAASDCRAACLAPSLELGLAIVNAAQSEFTRIIVPGAKAVSLDPVGSLGVAVTPARSSTRKGSAIAIAPAPAPAPVNLPAVIVATPPADSRSVRGVPAASLLLSPLKSQAAVPSHLPVMPHVAGLPWTAAPVCVPEGHARRARSADDVRLTGTDAEMSDSGDSDGGGDDDESCDTDKAVFAQEQHQAEAYYGVLHAFGPNLAATGLNSLLRVAAEELNAALGEGRSAASGDKGDGIMA